MTNAHASKHASHQELHAGVQQEFAVMTQLSDALKAEQAALVNGDVNNLAPITQDKSRLVAQVAELENTRNQRLGALGYNEDIQGWQDYLLAAKDPALSKTWGDLLQLSEQAKETNRTNGLLINRHLSRNHGALSALQRNNQSLYGPSGQSTVQTTSGRGFVVG